MTSSDRRDHAARFVWWATIPKSRPWSGREFRRAQEKLIDLSMRNSMLNYKHSESSSRHVRIIDEQIAFLVDALSSGRSLDIIPLPPVEEVPRDEDTDVFRAALKAAKEIDPEWLAAEDARRAAGNRRRARDKVAERALRDRMRVQLGMPEWRLATDPKARANELGINPDYDLPRRVGETPQASHRRRSPNLVLPRPAGSEAVHVAQRGARLAGRRRA